MTRYDAKVGLLHMRDYARKAIDMAKGRKRRELDEFEMFQLAWTQLVEMSGEAANRFLMESRENHPQIPWTKITGMHHRLINEQDTVDILWDTVKYDVRFLYPRPLPKTHENEE